MNAVLTHASIDLQGRMINLKLIADANGTPIDMECSSSIDEIIIRQSVKPDMNLFEALTIIASEKLSLTVTVPTDLSDYLLNI